MMAKLTPAERGHIRTIRAALETYEMTGGAVQYAATIEREATLLADAANAAHRARVAQANADLNERMAAMKALASSQNTEER